MQNNHIQTASRSDRKKVIELLTSAFLTDRSIRWVVGDRKCSKSHVRKLIDYAFRLSYIQNGILRTFDNKAAAIIMYPHSQKYRLRDMFLDLKLGVRVIGIRRISEVLKREEAIKKHHPKENFLYLWYLGVESQLQRSGLGSNMLDEIHRIADKQQLPIYLETSTPENIPFYERNGYEVYHEMKDFPGMDFPIWFIRRNSRIVEN
ncbi:MAG: GNAT family N-acetyltransferase [Bacteroidales bacterium]|nr:GNAT family N-acetyltransferase [Bacteroidales bacterium]